MNFAKSFVLTLFALALVSGDTFAWGSRPEDSGNKLDKIIEKDQDQEVNKALDAITDRNQTEQVEKNVKVGGTLS